MCRRSNGDHIPGAKARFEGAGYCPISEARASATTTAKEEADPYGMTARKTGATTRAKAKEEADPYGMTARKASATTRAKATEEADSQRE
jgi:hypothetical protein